MYILERIFNRYLIPVECCWIYRYASLFTFRIIPCFNIALCSFSLSPHLVSTTSCFESFNGTMLRNMIENKIDATIWGIQRSVKKNREVTDDKLRQSTVMCIVLIYSLFLDFVTYRNSVVVYVCVCICTYLLSRGDYIIRIVPRAILSCHPKESSLIQLESYTTILQHHGKIMRLIGMYRITLDAALQHSFFWDFSA